jgi:hypothetical protein
MNQERVKFLASKTNGAVFDDDCRLVTEIDYPDLYYYDREAALWAREFMEKTSHILESGHNFTRGDQAKLLHGIFKAAVTSTGSKKRPTTLGDTILSLSYYQKRTPKVRIQPKDRTITLLQTAKAGVISWRWQPTGTTARLSTTMLRT